MAEFLLLAAVPGILTLVSGLYLLTGLLSRLAHRRVIHSPLQYSLDPFELALLAGGRRRLAETVLIDGYLKGGIRVDRAASLIREPRVVLTSHPLSGRQLHPALAGWLSGAVVGQPIHPGRLFHGAARARWTDAAVDKLTDLRLVLPAGTRTVQHLRRLAQGLHSLVALVLTFPTILGTVLVLSPVFLEHDLPPAAGFLWPVTAAGIAYVLFRLYRRFGMVAVMVVTSMIVVTHSVLSTVPPVVSGWGLFFCAAWFAAYAVHLATRRWMGARTNAGDQYVAASRESLTVTATIETDDVLLTVALDGLRSVRKRPSTNPSVVSVSAFADDCGLGTTSGDGGPGGAYDADGGSTSFGGDSGGSGGGEGGGGGGGGGGDGGGSGGN